MENLRKPSSADEDVNCEVKEGMGDALHNVGNLRKRSFESKIRENESERVILRNRHMTEEISDDNEREMNTIMSELDSTLSEFQSYIEEKNVDQELEECTKNQKNECNEDSVPKIMKEVEKQEISVDVEVPLRKTSLQERRLPAKCNLLQLPELQSPKETSISKPDLKTPKSAPNSNGTDESKFSPKSPAMVFVKKFFQRNDSSDNLSSTSESPNSPISANTDIKESPTRKKVANRQSLQLALDPNQGSPKSNNRFSFYFSSKSSSPPSSRDSSPMSTPLSVATPPTPSPLATHPLTIHPSLSAPNLPINTPSPTEQSATSVFKGDTKYSSEKPPKVKIKGKHCLRHTQSSPNRLRSKSGSDKPLSPKRFGKLIKRDKKSVSESRKGGSSPSGIEANRSSDPDKTTCKDGLNTSIDIYEQSSESSGFKYYNPKDGSASPATVRKGVYVEPAKILRFQSVPDDRMTLGNNQPYQQ